jgi:site-specific recombinase XerD
VETTKAALLNAFRHWMKQNRGVTERTLDNYSLKIASLLEYIDDDPSRLDSRNLRAFILHHTKGRGKGNLGGVTTAIRNFLRYLIAEGKCAVGLDEALPALASWRLSTLPRYLPASDVERVVTARDSSTPTGSRDRAIILLLARLGLRGDDIVRLRIGDIDWQQANIRLSGKGRREVLLPLTQEVGDAILTYFERGRPAVDSDHVFIRAIAPLRSFSNSGLVTKVVARAIVRAGVLTAFRGAHVLRHSAATLMLRQGISLQDISAILRHRSIETTAQYAKVDVDLLQLVAQPWPEEVTSC